MAGIIERLVERLCESSGREIKKMIANRVVIERISENLVDRMLGVLNSPQTNIRLEEILKNYSDFCEADKFCHILAIKICHKFAQCPLQIFRFVQCLAKLMVTESNMLVVREKLKDREDMQFFCGLFMAFKYNPAAVVCLCLLSGQYGLAHRVVLTLGSEVDLNKEILTGFCKVASMLESPGFLCT
jgi:hypothetical protein